MLGTPERRLFVVRIIRFLTIVACLLFFVGVVAQLHKDVHQHRAQSSPADADDDQGSGSSTDDQAIQLFPKRYLPTLIVSRAFLLLLVLTVLLGHIPLANKTRNTLADLTFPLQGSPWAQTDMGIPDEVGRSQALDIELQGDLSRLIGSAIILLVSAAQELSRRINHYLLVTAFLLASIGLLNLAAAVLIYNPAHSGPFAPSVSKAFSSTAPAKSVLRERPRIPSYLHAVSASAFSSLQRLGTKKTTTGGLPRSHRAQDAIIQPASIPFPEPASRGIHRVPVPTSQTFYDEKAAFRTHAQSATTSPTRSTTNPLSPQLAQTFNGRHPLATDEALRIVLDQPVSATAAVAMTAAREGKSSQQDSSPLHNTSTTEKDKDVLIRMWTAQIAEQKQQQQQQGQQQQGQPVAATTTMIGRTGSINAPAFPTTQEPRLGGRMQITAPYLSLREARARYALHKAAMASSAPGSTAPGGTAAAAPAAAAASPSEEKVQNRAALSEIRERDDAVPPSAALPELASASPLTAKRESKLDVVADMRTLDIRSAPKFASMQGELGDHQSQRQDEQQRHISTASSIPKSIANESEQNDAALRARELMEDRAELERMVQHLRPAAGAPPCSASLGRTSATPSICISVSSSEDDRASEVSSRRGRRGPPPALSFHSCSRPPSAGAESSPTSSVSPPRSPECPRSETTRWSQPSAAYTMRTGITARSGTNTGTSTSASAAQSRSRTRDPGMTATTTRDGSQRTRETSSADGDRHLRERDSRYLSAVLASIRGPEQRAQMVAATAAAAVPAAAFASASTSDSASTPPLPPPYLPIERSDMTHGESAPSASSANGGTTRTDAPLRSPGMLSALENAQRAALARAKERNKKRSLWLAKVHAVPK
ncbi:hypothetical protein OC835_003506 [Tilletia horrida]|nr:hypothetical protein OC835_003506 [Tilletia horrida]